MRGEIGRQFLTHHRNGTLFLCHGNKAMPVDTHARDGHKECARFDFARIGGKCGDFLIIISDDFSDVKWGEKLF